jgi:molybdopterin/thiamine biosynthesis adenylyltransferase
MKAAPIDRPTACPGCGQPMTALTLPRKPLGEVTVDLCGGCQVLLFDAHESLQLTAGSTLRLFAAIHAEAPAPRHPLPEQLPCPRCRFPLTLTRDVQRTTRFTYYRCEAGHGRLTPFFQFLREKDFIRPLPPDELQRLKANVRTVRCSSCGAPIDLETQVACSYCRAPIAILDSDAVRKTVEALEAKDAARGTVDVETLVSALLDAQRGVRAPGAERVRGEAEVDLVDLGLTALGALLHTLR